LYSAYLVGCIVWYSGILSSVVIQSRWSIHSFCTVCEYAHVHWWAFKCYVQMLCCKWVLMLTECTYFTVIYLFIVLIFFIILWIPVEYKAPQNCLSSYCWIGDAGMCWCPNFQCCRIIHGFVWLVKMIFQWICWAVKYSRIFFWDFGVMNTNFLCMNCQNFLSPDFIIYAVIEKGWNCYVNVYFPTFSEESSTSLLYCLTLHFWIKKFPI
jgi:hypothetical protein